MLNAIEAVLQPGGRIGFSEPAPQVTQPTKVFVLFTQPITVESDSPSGALLSQAALAKDWSTPVEDAAWAHLNEAK